MSAGKAQASFPRHARLTTPDAFTRVLKTRPSRGKFLWIYRLDADPLTAASDRAATAQVAVAREALANTYCGPQLGMMIGKRNAKTAVLRNAIKRRLREQFRLRAAKLPARAYLVRLYAPATKLSVPLIVGEWVTALDLDIQKKKRLTPVKSAVAA